MATVRFEIQTPLGFTVRTTDEYWERIVSEKHRNMRGHEDEVKETLGDPDVVKQSTADPNVLLFYRPRQEGWDSRGCPPLEWRGVLDYLLPDSRHQERDRDMETKIKLFFDPIGNTLTVWFGDPDQEHLCEETGNDVILMKDRAGQVIGFEKLNFVPTGTEMPLVSFETMATPAR